VIVRRLVRSLDYAEGFWLGFVKCNLAAQRRKAVAACKELLEPLGIRLIEVELTEPISELLPILKERIATEQSSASELPSPSRVAEGESRDRQKLAIFVSGLEYSIPSSEAYPPILSYLNLNRELFRQELPHPLVIWLPEYALTALARRAPDFWAWRSGLYEFAPEADLDKDALDPIVREEMHIKSSLSGQAKRERLAMLKGLLADYCELGSGPHERQVQGDILFEIACVHDDLGEWAEAKQAWEKSLTIAHDQDDKSTVATITHNLGTLAKNIGDYEEARRLYEESLGMSRELGIKSGEALALHNLGILAQEAGDYEKAQRLYEESLEIKRELGHKSGEATTLHQLGGVAQDVGNNEKARRLYEETLEMVRELGDKFGEAFSLDQLALLDEDEGDYKEAVEHSRQAQEIYLQLGNQEYINQIKEQISRLEQKAESES
jgi:tetratricopeptide (TPR) repeat protein